MSEDNVQSEPEVVGLNRMGGAGKTSVSTPARAWFPDETGYQGEPIEYGGAVFYSREIAKADLKRFTKETQRLQRESKALEQNQAAELKALAADDGNGDDVSDAELPADREEFYEAESERIVNELEAAYNRFLEIGIVGWNLPRPFSKELLYGFSKADKVALCEAVGSRSVTGIEASKNSPRRLNR